MEPIHSHRNHLSVQPLSIVFVFTNPWAKSSHAIITIAQGDENEMWEYGNHLLENRDNRGRNEGGSYLVYALLDYVVSEIGVSHIGGFIRGRATLLRRGDSAGGGNGGECIVRLRGTCSE